MILVVDLDSQEGAEIDPRDSTRLHSAMICSLAKRPKIAYARVDASDSESSERANDDPPRKLAGAR